MVSEKPFRKEVMNMTYFDNHHGVWSNLDTCINKQQLRVGVDVRDISSRIQIYLGQSLFWLYRFFTGEYYGQLPF